MTDAPNAYVRLNDAARELRVCRKTIDRRIAARGIAKYSDPTDERYHLVKRADLEALRIPRPVARPARSR